MNEMLSIGQFARAAGPSQRVLRSYDQVGLLRPSHTDPNN
jgi:DNA-binding transcriptional MerR regulator